MRLQKTRSVLAIYGASCSGKTQLSRELSLTLGLQVRHCGKVVEARAVELGVNAVDLPLFEHQAIDADTRRCAIAGEGLIIEGRYLNAVLRENQHVKLVQLFCNDRVRESRIANASSGGQEALSAEDFHDRQLREMLYADMPAQDPWLVLDTSLLSVADLSDRLIDRLKHCASY